MKTVVGLLFVALTVWALVIAGRAMMGAPATVQAAALAPTSTQYLTPTFRPTETPIPTATIGYEATIFVAQATADEARRVNAQATAEHEAYILSIAQLTAESEKRSQEILSWTAIAGPTIIPLTATAQVIYNTQAAEGKAMVMAMLTSTAQAPTHVAAMARSQATVQFATVTQIANLIGIGAIALFCVGLFIFFVRWKPSQVQTAAPVQTETVVQMRRDNGQGSFSQHRVVVPCSPEQLTELAELAINGEKKFGINRLEQTSRTFRSQRETLILVRQFLVENKFVIPDNSGTITLNADGEAFLSGWFDVHRLPDEYEFESEKEIEKEPEQEPEAV